MQKQFILLGLLLASHLSTSAQTFTPETAPAQDRIAETVPIVRTGPTMLLTASLLPPENPGKFAVNVNYPFEMVYERDQVLESLESLSMMRQVKTLFLTESSLPLIQLWGGRLRLDGFTSTLHMQNVQLGPSASGGSRDFRPARQSYRGGPRSVDLYGLSLTFHFGRDAQIGRPTQIWRRVARIVRAAR
ncbi:MAG TPA: hypothetical protein VN788_09655 [Verrucomicrobiae bacterium]|nr:hypothetical protein [Verrucomicrobiae bacterium]